jgi:hypothetical protein
MYDQIAVRVRYCVTNLEEQLDALMYAELTRIAEFVKVNSFHELHRKVRLAVIGDSRIEQAGDVRVIERGKDVLLAMKSVHKRRTRGVRGQNFERYPVRCPSMNALR